MPLLFSMSEMDCLRGGHQGLHVMRPFRVRSLLHRFLRLADTFRLSTTLLNFPHPRRPPTRAHPPPTSRRSNETAGRVEFPAGPISNLTDDNAHRDDRQTLLSNRARLAINLSTSRSHPTHHPPCRPK